MAKQPQQVNVEPLMPAVGGFGTKMEVKQIPIGLLQTSEEYKRFQSKAVKEDPASMNRLAELADSIRQNGLIDPITVIKDEKGGTYTVISGNRRVTAIVTYLKSWKTVPASIVDPKDPFFIAFSANVMRVDMTDVEKGQWILKAEKQYEKNFADKKAMAEWISAKLGLNVKERRYYQLRSKGLESLGSDGHQGAQGGKGKAKRKSLETMVRNNEKSLFTSGKKLRLVLEFIASHAVEYKTKKVVVSYIAKLAESVKKTSEAVK